MARPIDIAYSFISPQKPGGTEEILDNDGDCVELTGMFDFVDLDYLESLFSKGGLVEFLKKNSKEKLKQKQLG